MYYWLGSDGEPVGTDDVLEWSKKFCHRDKQVAREDLGDVLLSTVFLGVDHAFGDGPPVLWETMIFGGPRDQDQQRYTSREDALAGHAEWLKELKGGA